MPPACLAVHGGAGLYDPAMVEPSVRGCRAALEAGLAVVDAGGSALDAVEASVRALEDDPTFNAGRGSVLNAEGEVEMDAAVMTGDLRAGAVGAVRRVKNPVSLARHVMERTPHVFLAGSPADEFARAQGLPWASSQDLVTERQLQRFRSDEPAAVATAADGGTVGAVALDREGRVAAATSTGGIFRKLPGRVGDTPVLGAGTYADGRAAAASATGMGEDILRVGLSRLAVDRVAAGASPTDAARAAVGVLSERTAGKGGVILVTIRAEVGLWFSTPRMSFALRGADGRVRAGAETRDLP